LLHREKPARDLSDSGSVRFLSEFLSAHEKISFSGAVLEDISKGPNPSHPKKSADNKEAKDVGIARGTAEVREKKKVLGASNSPVLAENTRKTRQCECGGQKLRIISRRGVERYVGSWHPKSAKGEPNRKKAFVAPSTLSGNVCHSEDSENPAFPRVMAFRHRKSISGRPVPPCLSILDGVAQCPRHGMKSHQQH
jgi:hypothetical protein